MSGEDALACKDCGEEISAPVNRLNTGLCTRCLVAELREIDRRIADRERLAGEPFP